MEKQTVLRCIIIFIKPYIHSNITSRYWQTQICLKCNQSNDMQPDADLEVPRQQVSYNRMMRYLFW